MRKHTTFIKDLPDLSDENLWKSFKEGNKDALSTIFLQHYDSLFSYSSRLLANEDKAKDIVQDLFFKLWNARETLGNCDNIRYYLLQSVRRLIIDQYQKKKRPFTTEIDENQLPPELPFESILISNQEKFSRDEELKKAFSRLSKRQQEAIYLRYFQQIEYPTIATIMGVNVQSVRNLIHTAIQQLKQELGNIVVLFLTLLKKVEKR